MKTIDFETLPATASQYVGALLSTRKRAGVVKALPAITYVRPSVVLDGAAIAAYVKVCGYQAAHGVPLLYPQMLTFPLAMAFFVSPDCPWPALGTVHLGNRVKQHHALAAGDDVRVEMSTGQLMAHDKGQMFDLDMKILRDGDLVWEATQTLLRIGVKNPTGEPFASALTMDTPLSHQADFFASSDLGRRYGKVSGDFNPIHMSALSAKLFGFRQAIAHGMWTKARALAALMPAAPVAQAEVAVEFKTPLFLPARASLWSTRQTTGSFDQAALFEVRNAKGDKPHLRGHLSYHTA